MKKFSVYIIALILILTGCNNGNNGNNNGEMPEFKTKEVTINNETSFEFQRNSFPIYYENNDLIFYLEVNDYIDNMKNMFEDNFGYEVDGKTIRFYLDEEETQEVILDFENNTVYTSVVDAGGSFFKVNESGEEFMEEFQKYFFTSEEVESGEALIDPGSVTYKLSDYDIYMYEEDGKYYVPFHVLQFILSEYEMKLVYNGEEFYYLEVYGEDSDLSSISRNVEIDNDVVMYNANFNRMLFDNYYGLKDFVDYKENFDIIKEKVGEETKSYFNKYDDFLASLKDLHTSPISYLYTSKFSYGQKSIAFQYEKLGTYIGLECYNIDEEVTYTAISDKTAVVSVPGFSGERFGTQYLEVLEEVRGYENIVLDLSCNLGGYAGNSALFIYPFTNDDIYMYSGDITGGQYNDFARKRNDTKLFDNNVYLLTSSSSFSAGNYAPVIFSDMELGTNIGEPSGGGTAAIAFVVMPNGAVITMSSGSYLLYDKNYEHVENGVKIDIPIDLSDVSSFDELHKLIKEAVE